MIRNYLFIIILFVFNYVTAQRSEAFKKVEIKVSNTFFKAPEKAIGDAYLLHKIAETNFEKQISYKYLGYVYDLTGKVDSARFYVNKRLTFTKLHFNKQLPYYESIISYSNWGQDYVDSQILIEKLTHALSTIKYDEFKEQKGLMYMLMGDVLLRENDLDNANAYFDKSFKLIKSKYAPIDYYLRKGRVAILQNKFHDAIIYLNKGIDVPEAKTTYTYPSFLNLIGYSSLMLGDLKNAKSYLNTSLAYQEKNKFETFIANTYLYLSYIAKEENSDQEIEYLNQSLSYSKKEPLVTKDIYLAYKGYFERHKQFELEKEYLQKFNQLHDSIFSTEKSKIKLDLESRYKLTESKKELEYKEQIIDNDKKVKKLYLFALVLFALLIIALFIVYRNKIKAHQKNKRIQKLLHEEQLKSNLENQKTALIKEKIKAKIEERERLSLELHDGIASDISALKLSLSSANNINNPIINTTVNKIDKLYHEVRNLSHDLNPDSITEIEFAQLIDKMCTEATANSGIKIENNILINNDFEAVNEMKLLSLYRILQELINNVIKHSKATQAIVEIIESNDQIILSIQDNGIGFTAQNISGIGLNNIKKRVTQLNGTISINANEGTAITLTIPIND